MGAAESSRVVVFLGGHPNDYQCEHYALVGHGADPSERSKVPVGVWRHLAAQSEAVCVEVVGTADTGRGFVESGWLRGELDALGLRNWPVRFTKLELNTAEGYWRPLEQLRALLSGPGRIIIDITHGFRAMPYLTGPLLSELMAREDNRTTEYHVIYAAKDAQESADDPVPVWDLTPVVRAVELARGAEAFESYGLADELARTFDRVGDASAADVSKALTEFADDLRHMRLPALVGSLPRFVAKLKTHHAVLARSLPPAGPLIQRIVERFEGLLLADASEAPVIGWRGLRLSRALAGWLRATKQLLGWACLTHENLETAFTLVAVADPARRMQPGQKGGDVKAQREALARVSTRLGRLLAANAQPDAEYRALRKKAQLVEDGRSDSEDVGKLATHLRTFSESRNDFVHCGLRPSPQSSEEVSAGIGAMESFLDELLARHPC